MFNSSLRVFLYLSVCTIFIFSGCEDSTTVGAGIFDSEDLEVLFTDDVELIATTVRLDSLKTFDDTDTSIDCLIGALPIRTFSSGSLPTHYLGSVNDERFGNSKSSIYTEVGFSTLPIFSGTIDSMILVLAYDTSAFYGDVNETFDVDIFRVLERIDALGDAIYNNAELQISAEPIGGRENIRYSLDSLGGVLIPGIDSSELQPPGIRIPFDPPTLNMSVLPLEIFLNNAAFTSIETFKELLNGLYITTSSDGNIMPGIRINSSSIELYYTDDDGDPTIFQFGLFNLELRSFNQVISDRAGSEAGLAAAGVSADDLLYVSGQDGFDVHIDISDVNRFQDFTLNKAELEFYVLDPGGLESRFFPPSQRLIVSELGDNNELICIEDMSIGFPTTFVGSLFGGDLVEDEESGTGLRKYTMNITTHIQNFLNGDTSPTLVLTVDNRTDNASRTVLFGPNHPTNRAKLNLTYTAQ